MDGLDLLDELIARTPQVGAPAPAEPQPAPNPTEQRRNRIREQLTAATAGVDRDVSAAIELLLGGGQR